MRKSHQSFKLAVLLTVGVTMSGASVVALPFVASASCGPDYEYLGARGSGEDLTLQTPADYSNAADKGMGAEIFASYQTVRDGLQAQGRSVSGVGVQYDAISVGNLNGLLATLSPNWGPYTDSVNTGLSWVRSEINRAHAACATTKFILGGYSQGAQVVGDSVSGLSAELRALVAGVFLVGDPRFNPGDTAADVGSYSPTHWGIFNNTSALSNQRPIWSTILSAPVVSLCKNGDFICGPDTQVTVAGVTLREVDLAYLVTVSTLNGTGADIFAVHSTYVVGSGISDQAKRLLKGMNASPAGVSSAPLDVALLLDTSRGCAGGPLQQLKQDFSPLADEIAAESSNSQVAVIAFSDNVQKTVGLTSDFNAVQSGINGLSASGGGSNPSNGAPTSVGFSALKAAIALPWRSGARRAVALMSCSGIKSSVLEPNVDFNGPEVGSGLTFGSTVTALQRAHIVVDSALLTDNLNVSTWAQYVALDTDGFQRSGNSNYGSPYALATELSYSYARPIASISGNSSGIIGRAYQFNGGESYIPSTDDSIVSYTWATSYIGAGTSSAKTAVAAPAPSEMRVASQSVSPKSEALIASSPLAANSSPTYTTSFAKTGRYSVNLTVTTANGFTASRTYPVSVAAAPTVAPGSIKVATTRSGDVVTVNAYQLSGASPETYRVVDRSGAVLGAFSPMVTATATRPASMAVNVSGIDNLGAIGDNSAGSTQASFAVDSFTRTTSNGLGVTPVGGAWTVSGALSNYSTNGSVAQIATPVGTTLTGVLGEGKSASASIAAAVVVPSLPTGDAVYAGIIGRRVATDDYRARFGIATSGAVTVQLLRGATILKSASTGVTATANSTLRLRLQVTGTSPTTIRARAWKSTSAEPTTWAATTTDTTAALQVPGTVGLLTYVPSTVRSGAYTFKYDDFAANGTVQSNLAPTATASCSTALKVLTCSGSGSDRDGSVASHAWDFGDGATASGTSATHTYLTGGSYTVVFSVTDNQGATATVTQTVSASGPADKDSFTRTVANGLGTADRGGAWTSTSPISDLSVDGSAGIINLQAGEQLDALLSDTKSTSFSVSADVTIPALPSDGQLGVGLIGRKVGDDGYRAYWVIAPSGSVQVTVLTNDLVLVSQAVSDLTVVPGETLSLRLAVTGSTSTTVQTKIWDARTEEPTDWGSSVSDSSSGLQAAGAAGIAVYSSNSVALRIDNFAAVEPQ